MVDLPRHFVEIQHHLNKMHKPLTEFPVGASGHGQNTARLIEIDVLAIDTACHELVLVCANQNPPLIPISDLACVCRCTGPSQIAEPVCWYQLSPVAGVVLQDQLTNSCKIQGCEDQYQFILHHEVMWNGSDVDFAVPMVEITKELFPDFCAASFDRGFYSPANRTRLDELLEPFAKLRPNSSPDTASLYDNWILVLTLHDSFGFAAEFRPDSTKNPFKLSKRVQISTL